MRFFKVVFCALAGLVLNSCQLAGHKHSVETEMKVAQTQHGVASIYTDRRTASGERFSAKSMSAAHKTWPMGTRVRVTHLSSGRHTTVRINDRGPYIRGRVIDLTPAAAAAIGLTPRLGIAKVKIERLH
jgi:rare lipoprotein A